MKIVKVPKTVEGNSLEVILCYIDYSKPSEYIRHF